MPSIADSARVRYLHAGAPWARAIGAKLGGPRLRPALAARVNLLYDETKADLRHEQEWEAVLFPIDGEQADMDQAVSVDCDNRDFGSEAPGEARYVLGDAKLNTKAFFTNAERDLKDRLYRGEVLTLPHNKDLKAYSRPGETAEDFEQRCAKLGEDAADADLDKVRVALAKKMDRIQAATSKAEDRVQEAESKAGNSRSDEILSGVGDVLGSILGGRKSSGSIFGGLRRAGSKRQTRQAASERVRTAENRLDEKVDQLEDLEQELADTVEDIVEDWNDKAANITTFEVGLEKADISVDDLTLVWIPTDGS